MKKFFTTYIESLLFSYEATLSSYEALSSSYLEQELFRTNSSDVADIFNASAEDWKEFYVAMKNTFGMSADGEIELFLVRLTADSDQKQKEQLYKTLKAAGLPVPEKSSDLLPINARSKVPSVALPGFMSLLASFTYHRSTTIASSSASTSSETIGSVTNTSVDDNLNQASEITAVNYKLDMEQIQSKHSAFLLYISTAFIFTLSDRGMSDFLIELFNEFNAEPKLAKTLLILINSQELSPYIGQKLSDEITKRFNKIECSCRVIDTIYARAISDRELDQDYRDMAYAAFMLCFSTNKGLLSAIYGAKNKSVVTALDILIENNIDINLNKISFRGVEYIKENLKTLQEKVKTHKMQDFLNSINQYEKNRFDLAIGKHIKKIDSLKTFLQSGGHIEKFIEQFKLFNSYDCLDSVLIIDTGLDIDNKTLYLLRLALTAILLNIYEPHYVDSLFYEEIFKEEYEPKIAESYKDLINAAVDAGCFDKIGFDEVSLKFMKLGMHRSGEATCTLRDMRTKEQLLNGIFKDIIDDEQRTERLVTTVNDLINKLQQRKELKQGYTPPPKQQNTLFSTNMSLDKNTLDLYPKKKLHESKEVDEALTCMERGFQTRFVNKFLEPRSGINDSLMFASDDVKKHFFHRLNILISTNNQKAIPIINRWRFNYSKSYDEIEKLAKGFNISINSPSSHIKCKATM